MFGDFSGCLFSLGTRSAAGSGSTSAVGDFAGDVGGRLRARSAVNNLFCCYCPRWSEQSHVVFTERERERQRETERERQTDRQTDRLSVCLSVRASVRPSVCLSLSLSLSVSVSVSVSVPVPVSVSVSVCLSVCLSVSVCRCHARRREIRF